MRDNPRNESDNTLIQRVFLHYSECRIEHSGLRLHEKTPTNQRDYTIRFEDISASRFSFVRYQRWLVIWSVCCVISMAYLLFVLTRQTITTAQVPLLVILFIITIGSCVLVWVTRREYIGFGRPGNALLFRANKPSRNAVAAFLDAMVSAKKAFLRDTYLRFDVTEAPAAILSRLLWLKEQEAITPQEFEAFKAQYAPPDIKMPATPMGFLSHPS